MKELVEVIDLPLDGSVTISKMCIVWFAIRQEVVVIPNMRV